MDPFRFYAATGDAVAQLDSFNGETVAASLNLEGRGVMCVAVATKVSRSLCSFLPSGAAFPSRLAAGLHSTRRIRRMLRGETTRRSDLDPQALTATLRAHRVERLCGEPHLWRILDGSDLRKPHATAMERLQPVLRLEGRGTVQ